LICFTGLLRAELHHAQVSGHLLASLATVGISGVEQGRKRGERLLFGWELDTVGFGLLLAFCSPVLGSVGF
jgi:hypothetical protein